MTLTWYRRSGDQEEYHKMRGHEEGDVDNYEDGTICISVFRYTSCEGKQNTDLILVVVGIRKRLNRAGHRFVAMAVMSIVQSIINDLLDYQL